MHKSTHNIPEVREKAADGNKTKITKVLIHPTNMGRNNNQPPWTINFNQNLSNTGKKPGDKQEREERQNDVNGGPPKEVNTVPSSSQSQTSSIGIWSSIGIGEFCMKFAKQGNAATLSWAVKFQLFKMHLWTSAWMRIPSSVVFLKGMPASGWWEEVLKQQNQND